MIQLILDNLFKIKSVHGLTENEIISKKSSIRKYLRKIEKRDQGFYKILDDKKTIEKIKTFAKKARGNFTHIIVLGIGGSALPAICLQKALKHSFKNELKRFDTPRLHVIDNIDPTLITELENIINYEKTLFIVISKSGETIETLSQYEYFRGKCGKKNLNLKKHFVFITDPKKGKLRNIANKENIPAFDIPENIGGRFSILTAAGLLPAALIDIDIEKLLAGAKKEREKFLNKKNNSAFTLATIQYLLSKKGKTINVLMPYAQKLTGLCDWYKQLLAESIAEKFDNNGKEIFTGITPIGAIGATDQHSQIQLYNEGPNDKLIIFIEAKKLGKDVQIRRGLTFNKLISIEKQSTAEILTINNRPNLTILVDSISEESLGELFILFEGATAFLGEFYNINAFSQEGVELGKKLIKELLEK